MKTSYLDYYKIILDKVSFSHQLFSKEYKKAMNILQPEEKAYLNNWLRTRGLMMENVVIRTPGTSNTRSVAA